MADDTDIDDGPVLVGAQRRQKKESLMGNIIEGWFTYLSGATIYAPFHIWLLFFTGSSLSSPETAAQLWPAWITVTLYYWGANALSAVENTKAKYSSRTFRFFADFACSATPLVLDVFMVVLAALGVYHPEPTHILIAIFMSVVCIIDLTSHSNLVQTAIRRVREGFADS